MLVAREAHGRDTRALGSGRERSVPAGLDHDLDLDFRLAASVLCSGSLLRLVTFCFDFRLRIRLRFRFRLRFSASTPTSTLASRGTRSSSRTSPGRGRARGWNGNHERPQTPAIHTASAPARSAQSFRRYRTRALPTARCGPIGAESREGGRSAGKRVGSDRLLRISSPGRGGEPPGGDVDCRPIAQWRRPPPRK